MLLKIVRKDGRRFEGPFSHKKDKILGMIAVRPFPLEDCQSAIIVLKDGTEINALDDSVDLVGDWECNSKSKT